MCYVPMAPLGPYIIDKKRYVTILHASKIVGETVTASTLWHWAKKRCTPWGLRLDVEHQRPPPETKWHNKGPRRKMPGFRMLLAEKDAFMLKDLLQEFRVHAHETSRLRDNELADLEMASRHYRPRYRPPDPNC
jgi:hypothetical protein